MCEGRDCSETTHEKSRKLEAKNTQHVFSHLFHYQTLLLCLVFQDGAHIKRLNTYSDQHKLCVRTELGVHKITCLVHLV